MNRSTYQAHAQVRDFNMWATPLVSGERPFSHKWHSRNRVVGHVSQFTTHFAAVGSLFKVLFGG
jgi:hypothetical protein